MTRTTFTGYVITAALVAAFTVAAPAAAQPAATKLSATVGPGFTISLKAAGKKVANLKPGSYTITIDDRSRIHDFRLSGPGLNKVISGVSAVGAKTVTVRLRAGKYRYVCQPHAGAMNGAFSVR